MPTVAVVQAGTVLGESAQNLPDVPIRGESCVVGPMGDLLAGSLYGEEAIVPAQVDIAELPAAKFDFDVVGHYARPDVFDFAVKGPNVQPGRL